LKVELSVPAANTLPVNSSAMNDWNIQSRAHACETCEQAFTDQQPYHTVLVDVKHEFLRRDVCAACWERQFAEAQSRTGFVSHWQGVYLAPPPPTEVIQKDTAESLLRKLIELNDPRYVPAGYILAVMLERKRLLKVKEQVVTEGRRTFIYEMPKTGEIFTITDPDLHLDQLEAVQRDVANLLEHGLNPPAATPADSATPAASGDETDAAPAAVPAAQPVA
jgi:hypothetical protein